MIGSCEIFVRSMGISWEYEHFIAFRIANHQRLLALLGRDRQQGSQNLPAGSCTLLRLHECLETSAAVNTQRVSPFQRNANLIDPYRRDGLRYDFLRKSKQVSCYFAE